LNPLLLSLLATQAIREPLYNAAAGYTSQPPEKRNPAITKLLQGWDVADRTIFGPLDRIDTQQYRSPFVEEGMKRLKARKATQYALALAKQQARR
jgi:hypothetical protein